MDIFYTLMSIAIPLYLFLVPKGQLTMAIMKNVDSNKSLSIYEKVYCFVPFYNSFLIRRSLYGSALFSLINFYAVSVLMIFNIVVRSLFFENELLQLIMTLVMLFLIVYGYFCELFIAYNTSTLFSSPRMLIFILIPPVSNFFVSKGVDKHFRVNQTKIEGTFDGGHQK